MVVEGRSNRCDWSGRWSHVQKLLMRSGPLAHQDFEPGSHVRKACSFNSLTPDSAKSKIDKFSKN